MKKIVLGHNKEGKSIELDFEAERLNFFLLIGNSGSGKSVFHNNLYKQLSEQYSSDEIGFVFLDMTCVEFSGWQPAYLIHPVVNSPQEGIRVLEELPKMIGKKMVFVHIEECDMVYFNRNALERALKKITGLPNVRVVYSTSRIDKQYLGDWMKRLIDFRAVFSVSTVEDSIFLTGDDSAHRFNQPGEMILIFNKQRVFCNSLC